MRPRPLSVGRATSIVLVVGALLAGAASSARTRSPTPSTPPAGPAFTSPPAYAVPEAATYTFGLQPLADVMAAAAAQAQCGLTQNELATMVLAPTYPETGAINALSPSPMTLSRYDTSSGLYAFDNPATPYPRAFWHPGIGAWQFDSAGGWLLSAAQEMSTDTAAATAAQVIATRWCNDTADAANPVARRANAWAPWNGCGVAGATCEAIYQTIYSPGTLNVATDASVTRTGGMVARTCQLSGSLPVTCSRVDPALAQGDAAFAVPGFGPSPVTAPFYDFVIGSTEYHVWLKDDTGYGVTIAATLAVGSNARTSLTWSTGDVMCDLTASVGACGPELYIRNSNTTGVADTSYVIAAPRGGTVLACDWDGNGTATAGEFVNGTWYITNSTAGGTAQQVFGYGEPGDIPVCGDWNGDGTQTPGVVRNGTWYLVNSLAKPFADVSFPYGNPTGDIPVVGDWNGDGTQTPGVVRNGTWYLVNSLAKPFADMSFGYGNPTGDIPVVGDWNGDHVDTPGIVRNGTWYLSNTSGHGLADVSFGYGDPGDAVVTGRWAPGAATTIAVVR